MIKRTLFLTLTALVPLTGHWYAVTGSPGSIIALIVVCGVWLALANTLLREDQKPKGQYWGPDSELFQDPEGNIPVTGYGQPVGFIKNQGVPKMVSEIENRPIFTTMPGNVGDVGIKAGDYKCKN